MQLLHMTSIQTERTPGSRYQYGLINIKCTLIAFLFALGGNNALQDDGSSHFPGDPEKICKGSDPVHRFVTFESRKTLFSGNYSRISANRVCQSASCY